MIAATLTVVTAYAVLRRVRWPNMAPGVSPVTADPEVMARIKAYTALSMVERYGAHGPP